MQDPETTPPNTGTGLTTNRRERSALDSRLETQSRIVLSMCRSTADSTERSERGRLGATRLSGIKPATCQVRERK